MTDCVFCRIVAGEVPAHLVFEDPAVVAFLDDRPVFKGHVLVVPRQRYASDEEAADYARRIAAALAAAAR